MIDVLEPTGSRKSRQLTPLLLYTEVLKNTLKLVFHVQFMKNRGSFTSYLMVKRIKILTINFRSFSYEHHLFRDVRVHDYPEPDGPFMGH